MVTWVANSHFDDPALKYCEEGNDMLETKESIYDEMCRILTNYESGGCEEGIAVTANNLYDMLVKIQNNWENVITCDS